MGQVLSIVLDVSYYAVGGLVGGDCITFGV